MELGFRELREFQDKLVVLRSTEGEVMRIKVTFVSRSAGDLIYDLIETNQPERYAGATANAAYSIPFAYIAEIRLAE